MATTSSFADSWMSKNENFAFPPQSTTEGQRRMQKLRKCWRRATTCFPQPDSTAWFEGIISRHCDESRAYHTAVHLEEMFGYLKMLKGVDERDYRVLALSIFFHDAVYDAKSSTNEKDSAELFRKFFAEMGKCNDPELEERVVAYILATQTHKIAADDDKCLGFLLDMDIAVLGKETQAYQKYAALIRKEYCFVEHKLYCEKRAEILEQFVTQPRLFSSDIFRSQLEERARRNLQEEIASLRKGAIPGGEVCKTS